MTRAVLIFARAPRLGEVKRRLAAGIGEQAALDFYRENVRRLVERLVAAPALDPILVVTPDDTVDYPSLWPPGPSRFAQGDGDLGVRMVRALNAAPGLPAVLIGSDVPGIEPAHLSHAFDLLARHDVVLGPSPDGGFWLVGTRRPLPGETFRDVRWSSEHALIDSIGSLRPGWRHALADELADVDDAEDHARRYEKLPA
jgi:rSAM/selenodomain-associated transferase 1